MELFYEICKENMGEPFVFLDVDIQFFSSIADILLEELEDYDIACQHDIHQYNSGQFICMANDRTLSMFEKMKAEYTLEDQTTLNHHLHMCKHKFLSKRFFTVGHAINKQWDGENFEIPTNIVSHHANWVVGVDNKIKIMDIVREKYDRLSATSV